MKRALLNWLAEAFGLGDERSDRPAPGGRHGPQHGARPEAVPPAPPPRDPGVGAGQPGRAHRFVPNWLTWPVPRSKQPFRAWVFEPASYAPATHAALFNAVLTHFISPPQPLLDPYEPRYRLAPRGATDGFDLLTFPEAFLPWTDLLAFLEATAPLPYMGCIHVGLRPQAVEEQHMFRVDDLRARTAALSGLPIVVGEDLQTFVAWLAEQPADAYVNVGCLMAKDVRGLHRLCLHAKLVRSRYEFGARDGRHMHEANLLSLVTLRPEDPTLLSTTIHPLLCSDALNLETDRPGGQPIRAMTSSAECFGSSPPEHIDVVSVAVCSPQVAALDRDNTRYLHWHKDYLDAFVAAARDPDKHRHQRAVFLLSNYAIFPDEDHSPAGLSGAFLPMPPKTAPYANFITASMQGKPGTEQENRWSTPCEFREDSEAWRILGHLVTISPDARGPQSAGALLGFTIDRLPREINYWRGDKGVTQIRFGDAVPTATEYAIRLRGRP
jgi:hypothetical protein